MKKDYEFVLKVIRNKDNKLQHSDAVKKLINIWEIKWKGSGKYSKNMFGAFLHSLNINFKRSFR